MKLTDIRNLNKNTPITIISDKTTGATVTGFFRELNGTGSGTKVVYAEKKGSSKTSETNFRNVELAA